jgi:hypothetical protein
MLPDAWNIFREPFNQLAQCLFIDSARFLPSLEQDGILRFLEEDRITRLDPLLVGERLGNGYLPLPRHLIEFQSTTSLL